MLPEEKKGGKLIEKGPGDASTDVQISKWRGDEGTSDAKGGSEGDVEYKR